MSSSSARSWFLMAAYMAGFSSAGKLSETSDKRLGMSAGSARRTEGQISDQSSTTLPPTPALAISKPFSHSVAGSTSVTTAEMLACSAGLDDSMALMAYQVSYISRP